MLLALFESVTFNFSLNCEILLALSSSKVMKFKLFCNFFVLRSFKDPFPFLVGGATQHLLLTLGNLLSPYSDAILRMKITRGADSIKHPIVDMLLLVNKCKR